MPQAAASLAQRDVRVLARGRSLSQATIRSTLIAAAVATCCKCVEDGKGLIYQIVQQGKELGPELKLAYVPNYDLESGQLLTAGVDLWLNMPEPPYEAFRQQRHEGGP